MGDAEEKVTGGAPQYADADKARGPPSSERAAHGNDATSDAAVQSNNGGSPQSPDDDTIQKQRYVDLVAANPWYVHDVLQRMRHDGGTNDEWIATAVAILRAACTRAASPSAYGVDKMNRDEYKRLLGRLGIPRTRDLARCESAIGRLVALWEALGADRDALETARVYLDLWPPTRSAIAALSVEVSSSSAGTGAGAGHKGDCQRATHSGPSAVSALGDAVRRCDPSRRVESCVADGEVASPSSTDEKRYLILRRRGVHYYDVAVLVAVGRHDGSDGAGTLLGRMLRQEHDEDTHGLQPVPAPAHETLPSRLRPYAAFVPALLVAILDHCGVYDPSERDPDLIYDHAVDNDEEDLYEEDAGYDGGDDYDAEPFLTASDAKDFFPRHSEHYWTAPLAQTIGALMCDIASPADVPARIILTHAAVPDTLRGQFAWLDERTLLHLLAHLAGRHTLGAFALARSRYGPSSVVADDTDDDDDGGSDGHDKDTVAKQQDVVGNNTDDIVHEDGDGLLVRHRDDGHETVCRHTRRVRPHAPRALALLSRRAAATAKAHVPIDSLPEQIGDPLALDIWLTNCANSVLAIANSGNNSASDNGGGGGDNAGETAGPSGDADSLADVARYWGAETAAAAQTESPSLLCGDLAPHVVARTFPGGERFTSMMMSLSMAARVGPPLLTTAECDAIAIACYVSRRARHQRQPPLFVWTADVQTLAQCIVRDDPWLGQFEDKELDAVVDRVCVLVAEANEKHNRPKPIAGAPSPAAVSPADRDENIDTRVQVLIALAAVRSGIPIDADDLADAHKAAAIGGPLNALYP
ncbi:hypothetical protein pmac_cds_925 [Pandoravirus macleodensis]|uniref:Uncharacterized protein n=1 Tax=Pandoravirus macleodensis TaxID=2107707 RepID=A0A2U7UGH4_9VIRU|nr:hypothetical protein pmac_cds_925 [Pandoravirus macleodensis]AVK77613.1 hypothetical protein pmac_cds_925 [Pandoravirus macleodensis]